MRHGLVARVFPSGHGLTAEAVSDLAEWAAALPL